MKGLFIPGMTVEKFRNKCFESIETLIAEDEIFDIDYDPRHIPAIRDKLWEIQQCSNCVLNSKKKIVEIEPPWIPISKDLPKIGRRVLVTREWEGDRYIEKDMRLKYSWMEDEICGGKVVAWRALPKPYQGGDDE